MLPSEEDGEGTERMRRNDPFAVEGALQAEGMG